MTVRIRPGARVVWAKPPPEYKRLPWNAAILPRLPLGGDDDRRRGVLGRIGGGVELLGAGVAHLPSCPGRAAKDLKSVRLKAERKFVLVQRAGFVIILWFGRSPRFRVAVFDFPEFRSSSF